MELTNEQNRIFEIIDDDIRYPNDDAKAVEISRLFQGGEIGLDVRKNAPTPF